ncbi:MAG: hypothetical protein QM703_24900 [Gemmatales bacterium]
MKTLRLFALSVVAAGLVAGSVFAENGKPANPGDTQPAPAAKQGEHPLQDRLENALKATGIPFEKKWDEKGKYHYFAVKEYTHEYFNFELEESKDKHYTWVLFPCTKVPETGIPNEIMEKLMSENAKMGVNSFQYYPKTRMLYLKSTLSTASLDGNMLKGDIHNMLKDASRTRPLWDSTQWSTSASK